jgi:hypothetical protein
MHLRSIWRWWQLLTSYVFDIDVGVIWDGVHSLNHNTMLWFAPQESASSLAMIIFQKYDQSEQQ